MPVITDAPSAGPDPLRIVHVERTNVTLSTGEVLFVRSEKLWHLCEQLWQDWTPVTVRCWWTQTSGGMVNELIEVHRVTTMKPDPVETEAF